MKAQITKVWQWLGSEQALRLSASLVVLGATLAALPSLCTPLGLPPEGDAVDYRIPLIKWILRHRSYPNWPWSMVDDYPLLSELLMTPLYGLYPSLARLVPIAGYLGLAFFAGKIMAFFSMGKLPLQASTLVLLGMAWTLEFRPVVIQSNLLMIDNVSACFLLGALYFVITKRATAAGLLAALAMATRYTVWATVAVLPFFLWWISERERRWKNIFTFCALAFLGALPFMVRNYFINNGNPIFPIGDAVFAAVGTGGYGRGTHLWQFLLLPWDLLYTNTFVVEFYDYTLGKAFYLQLLAMLVLWCLGKRFQKKLLAGREGIVLALFALAHGLIWFKTSQQLRFLVPALVVANMAMLLELARSKWPQILLAVTLIGFFSILSVQKDSILLALGKRESIFKASHERALSCFERAGVGKELIGYVDRDGMLGFLNDDFYYLPHHPYAVKNIMAASVHWVYTPNPQQGYEPWPLENPCMQRKH